MKKTNFKLSGALIIALFWVLFDVLTLVLAVLPALRSFWFAFAFINVAFAVSVGVVLLQKIGKNVNISLLFPQYVATAIYFALTFIINFIFMVCPSTEVIKGNIVLNIIVIVLYAAITVYFAMHVSHANNTRANIENKVSALRGVESKVVALSYSTSDVNIKKRLEILKQKVRFSDPMSNDAVAAIEQEILEMIDAIGTLISSGAEAEAIMKAVDDCANKVELRGKILISSK